MTLRHISDPDLRAAVERSIATSAAAVPWIAVLAAHAKAVASARARAAAEAALEAVKVADSAAIWNVTLANTSIPYAMADTREVEWSVEEAKKRASISRAAVKKADAARASVRAAVETAAIADEVLEIASGLTGELPELRDSEWLAERAGEARDAVSAKLDEAIEACRDGAKRAAIREMFERLSKGEIDA